MSLLSAVTRPARPVRRTPRRRLVPPVVVAHRGASGYRPEHTLAAYQLAMEMGADYVEPDLVPTSDGVLVARHESEISGTTDVAMHAGFADRFVTKLVDGRFVSGWFTEDFTLEELKSLRAVERMARMRPRNRRYDGLFDIPTFDEVLDLVEEHSRLRGEVIGVCPELKTPTRFESVGLDPVSSLVESLERRHLNRTNARVMVQSFEPAVLRRLREVIQVPLVQLVGPSAAPYALTPADLTRVAGYADCLGVAKELVLPRDRFGWLAPQTRLVDLAHAAGLDVLVWTLRDENRFMAENFRTGSGPKALGSARQEYACFFDAGVDGVFTDHPDTAVAAVAVH